MLHLLIATDDYQLWERLQAEAEGAGATAHWALNGLEALELAAAHATDLVLLDIGLDVLSAGECGRTLRADPELPGITIYLLTDEAIDPRTVEKSGAAGVFRKTPAAGELMDLIARLMAEQA